MNRTIIALAAGIVSLGTSLPASAQQDYRDDDRRDDRRYDDRRYDDRRYDDRRYDDRRYDDRRYDERRDERRRHDRRDPYDQEGQRYDPRDINRDGKVDWRDKIEKQFR